jgi:hypothetical protein
MTPGKKYKYDFFIVELVRFEERERNDVAIIKDMTGEEKEVFKSLFVKHAEEVKK